MVEVIGGLDRWLRRRVPEAETVALPAQAGVGGHGCAEEIAEVASGPSEGRAR